MSRIKFTVGSDPEFFLQHRTHGIIPATAFNTPGTKLEPTPIPNSTAAFHRDNVAVELMHAPGATPEEFMENTQNAYDLLTQIYRSNDLNFTLSDCVRFSKDRLKGLAEAAEIGCEPDLCAWTGHEAAPTSAELMGNIRVAGGHIHIGVDGYDHDELRKVIQWMDIIESAPNMVIEDGYRITRANRRQYYGAAGRYRLKPYGVEYRTPSNTGWHAYMEGNARHLFPTIQAVLSLVKQGVTVQDVFPKAILDRARAGINGRSISNSKRNRMFNDELRKVIYKHSATVAALSEAEEIYGHAPTVFST